VNQLPAAFVALEPFVGWAIPTETGRMLRRADSSQAEIIAFRDGMMRDLDAIIAHLDEFQLGSMPEPEARLYAMLMSLAEIAPAVEFYQQPNVIDGFDPRRFLPVEDFILRPNH
jgi:hypothetical protein